MLNEPDKVELLKELDNNVLGQQSVLHRLAGTMLILIVVGGFGENLSFTPWHALPEHRPLGLTYRLRKVIYEHISQVRHEMNSSGRREP